MAETKKEVMFDHVKVKLGVSLGSFSLKHKDAFLSFKVDGTSKLFANDDRDYSEAMVDDWGNYLGYRDVTYSNLPPVRISALMEKSAQITSVFRLLINYSLEPDTNQKNETSFKSSVTLGIDLLRFSKEQFDAYISHIPLFVNLRELYLDKALTNKSFEKYLKKQDATYIWDGLVHALDSLQNLEVISFRENGVHKYSTADFDGLLRLLSRARTVVFVDLSRNTLYDLSDIRFKRLMLTLRNMLSLLSVVITEHEPVIHYQNRQRKFEKLASILFWRTFKHYRMGCGSLYAEIARRAFIQKQSMSFPICHVPPSLLQIKPDRLFEKKLLHRIGLSLPTFFPMRGVGFQTFRYADRFALQQQTDKRNPQLLHLRNQAIQKSGSFLWLQIPERDDGYKHIARVLDDLSKLTNIMRLIFGYTIPHLVDITALTSEKYVRPWDLPLRTRTQFDDIVNGLPQFKGLRELYLDAALNATDFQRADNTEHEIYIWSAIRKTIQQMPKLEVLSLRSNNISNYSDSSFQGLINLLDTAENIVYLDLSENSLQKLSVQRFIDLCSVLERMLSLLSVSIADTFALSKFDQHQDALDQLQWTLLVRQGFYQRTGFASEHKQMENMYALHDQNGSTLRSIFEAVRTFLAQCKPKITNKRDPNPEFIQLLNALGDHATALCTTDVRTCFRVIAAIVALAPTVLHFPGILDDLAVVYRYFVALRNHLKDLYASSREPDFELLYHCARIEFLFESEGVAMRFLSRALQSLRLSDYRRRKLVEDEIMAIKSTSHLRKTHLGEEYLFRHLMRTVEDHKTPPPSEKDALSSLDSLLLNLNGDVSHFLFSMCRKDAFNNACYSSVTKGFYLVPRYVAAASSSISHNDRGQAVQPKKPLPAPPGPRAKALALLAKNKTNHKVAKKFLVKSKSSVRSSPPPPVTKANVKQMQQVGLHQRAGIPQREPIKQQIIVGQGAIKKYPKPYQPTLFISICSPCSLIGNMDCGMTPRQFIAEKVIQEIKDEYNAKMENQEYLAGLDKRYTTRKRGTLLKLTEEGREICLYNMQELIKKTPQIMGIDGPPPEKIKRVVNGSRQIAAELGILSSDGTVPEREIPPRRCVFAYDE